MGADDGDGDGVAVAEGVANGFADAKGAGDPEGGVVAGTWFVLTAQPPTNRATTIVVAARDGWLTGCPPNGV